MLKNPKYGKIHVLTIITTKQEALNIHNTKIPTVVHITGLCSWMEASYHWH